MDRKDKIKFLLDVQAGKVDLPRPVKHLDLSPGNLPKIRLEELQMYLGYVHTLSRDQQKELRFSEDQVFNAFYNRIIQQQKICLLKWINPSVIYDDVSTETWFTFKNIESFGFTELIEELERRWGRKFNPNEDYPEISDEEMKKYILIAPPVDINNYRIEGRVATGQEIANR